MPDDTVQRAPSGHADVALVRAVAAMRPGWMVLRGCELAGGDAGARARVGYALLHLDVGIALLDVLPGATTPDAPDLLRRSLDAGAFPEMFGGYPPIVHLRVPTRSLPGLGSLLAKEFARLRPLALAPRKAWVGSAQRMLTAEPPLCGQAQAVAEGRPPPIRPPGPARAEGRRASLPPEWRWRGLGAFWGAVALAIGSVALVLQHLGPPSGGPHDRRAAASPGEPYSPQTASHARPGTAPAERPPVGPAAEAAHTEAALRAANAAANDAAGRDHSEPAAPATPDGGPERSLVHAARASPLAGSAARASAAMDATGTDAESVGGTPVAYAPEGAAPSAGPSTTGAGGLPESALLAEGSDVRPMPATSGEGAPARAATEAQLAQLQEEARREQAMRNEILARPEAAPTSSSGVTPPLPSPGSPQAEHGSGAGSGAAPSAAASNSGHRRVVLHHRAGSYAASEAASAITMQVRDSGFELSGTRAVSATPSQRVVRYFRSEDAPAAAHLAGRLGQGWALQDFRAYGPLPAPGMLEVWLPER